MLDKRSYNQILQRPEQSDFAYKTEKHSNKKDKRQYLKDDLANEFTNSLISEEALLLAKYLRNEKRDWNPRIPIVV